MSTNDPHRSSNLLDSGHSLTPGPARLRRTTTPRAPQDTSGLHSQGLAALANVTAHELSEARSDPTNPGAWYDGAGAENGDKCAWTFNVPLVTLSNNSQWKLQGEWSNVAYNTNTGYPNASGQHGCVDGF